jgi:hypothetical protein
MGKGERAIGAGTDFDPDSINRMALQTLAETNALVFRPAK